MKKMLFALLTVYKTYLKVVVACGVVWCDVMMWCGVKWCGVVWYGVVVWCDVM